MSTKIAQITAAAIVVLSIVAILFQTPLGLTELSEEGFAFIGIVIGSATTFLFLAKTKNNGTLISRGNN